MCRQVLPGLYVGNYQDSKDADQLERFEITHILAIHDTARRLHSVSLRAMCLCVRNRRDRTPRRLCVRTYARDKQRSLLFSGQTLLVHLGR